MKQIINDSKAYISKSFFENIFSNIQLFYVRSSGHRSFFLILDFQSQQKLAKKITDFSIRFNSKHLTYFINLTCFCLMPEKKNCNGPFLDTQELQSSNTLKANVCMFLYISLKKILFQRRSKILYDGIGGGWRLNNFLKAAHYLHIVECFTIFHLNYNFWTFNNSTPPTIP